MPPKKPHPECAPQSYFRFDSGDNYLSIEQLFQADTVGSVGCLRLGHHCVLEPADVDLRERSRISHVLTLAVAEPWATNAADRVGRVSCLRSASQTARDGNNPGRARRYEWRIIMLDGHVLVLNRVFQAVQITSARRALTLLYKGQVKAVDSEYRTYDFDNWADIPVQADDDHYVRTPSRNILIPHVVQLLVFDRLPRQEVKFSRGNIYLRDGNRCQYCGKKFSSSELSLDHVVPISRGGKSTWENVVCACLPCNVKKGNKLLTETGLQLKRQPVRPRWHPLHRLQGRNFPDIWKNFLDEAYWNVELKE